MSMDLKVLTYVFGCALYVRCCRLISPSYGSRTIFERLGLGNIRLNSDLSYFEWCNNSFSTSNRQDHAEE